MNFYNSDWQAILKKFFEDNPKIQFQEYIGSRQNGADLLLTDGLTLSVKSNKSQSKVCPSRIGQLTKKRFCEELHLPKNVDLKSYILKTASLGDELFNIIKIYLVAMQSQLNKFFYLFIDRKNAFPYPFDKKEEFSFTRDIENWEESTTIKYKKISIGK